MSLSDSISFAHSSLKMQVSQVSDLHLYGLGVFILSLSFLENEFLHRIGHIVKIRTDVTQGLNGV